MLTICDLTVSEAERAWYLSDNAKTIQHGAGVDRVAAGVIGSCFLDNLASVAWFGAATQLHVGRIETMSEGQLLADAAGILTPDEVALLLASPRPWSDHRHYALNLLALVTG
jgi:hypothetical protein